MEALLRDAEFQRRAGAPRRIVVDALRRAVAETRQHLLEGTSCGTDEEYLRRQILGKAGERIREAMAPHYRRVVNATGVILHTALGRAVLPARAIRQISQELAGYSLLQADIATGERPRNGTDGSSGSSGN